MSGYTRNQIREYGVTGISKVLPLDEETISQMVDYVLDNLHSRPEMAKYFTDLIGEDPDCVQFITKFQDMVFGEVAPIKSPVPARKKKAETVILQSNNWESNRSSSTKKTKVWGQEPKEQEKVLNKPRLAKQAKSTTTSELIDKKPSTVKKSEHSKSSKKRTLKNLQDIESALTQLEISDDFGADQTAERRVCNCMATRHPLFEFYPNCLNCGKIICAKEGLQPCSSCGKSLLSEAERLEILTILTSEKLDLESKADVDKSVKKPAEVPRQKKKEQITISLNAAGEHNYRKQEAAFKRLERQKEIDAKKIAEAETKLKEAAQQEEELKYFKARAEKDPELLKAQERLDTLLNFQSTGAERTKIIDRASDFDIPNKSANLWTSPMERALQLKKQQRQLRKQEEEQKARSGRGRKVLDMSIRDGKVYLREEVVRRNDDGTSPEPLDSEDEADLAAIDELQKEINTDKAKEEAKKIATYWDYEKDKQKWEKPVYMTEESELAESSDPQPPLHSSRVQTTATGETEEMLISIPTL